MFSTPKLTALKALNGESPAINSPSVKLAGADFLGSSVGATGAVAFASLAVTLGAVF